MNYLLRAARRQASGVAAGGAVAARPALPSRSPLAEFDQRLNLDSFAARFDLPPAAERPAPDEDGTLATPAVIPRAEQGRGAERPPTFHAETPARARRPAPPGKSERAEAQGRRTDESQAVQPPPRGTRSAEQPSTRPAETSSETSSPIPPPPARAARRPNALPSPASDTEPPASPLERPRPPSLKITAGERPPAAEAAPQNLRDALSRALAWVEGGPRGPREEGRDANQPSPPAAVPSPRPAATPAAQLPPPTASPAQPVTRLEIGRIEVEIVPPARPTPRAAPARPAPQPGGFAGARRLPFGWRQR